jgi:hypothetical protein
MAHQARHNRGAQVVKKVHGLYFASVLLCSGGAQAFQLNAHMPPTIHQLNPQPLPPGIKANPTGGGTGKILAATGGYGRTFLHNGTHIGK